MVEIRKLFETVDFRDRFNEGFSTDVPVDVVIPVLHANVLWEANLFSFYREVPIRRLIVGDAGAIDGSIDILSRFPRVKILDHSAMSTLGKSLAGLIEAVESEFFVYLQSDVFLPPGWFDSMLSSTGGADWVGCPELNTVLIQYTNDYSESRPSLPGAQLGRTRYFAGVGERIDDDFVYRQEDFVLSEVVVRNGGRIGQNHDTYHAHELMKRKTTGEAFDVVGVSITKNSSNREEERVHETQLYGFIKYCSPDSEQVISGAREAYKAAVIAGVVKKARAISFAERENAAWVTTVRKFPAPWRFFLLRKLELAFRSFARILA